MKQHSTQPTQNYPTESAKVLQSQSQPSFSRWWRQATFVPLLHSKWMTSEMRSRLTQKVTAAEQGHRGEVFLIVENHLPVHMAYHTCCHERAVQLFSEYRVWDTEENTGVLVYVNVCEHDLQIIADRGISVHVSPTVWRAMCAKAISGLANNKVEESLSELLEEIGQLLRQHYHLEHDPEGNELPDEVVFL